MRHGKQKKISSEAVNLIKDHAHKFQAYKSHYTRRSSERNYLNPSLTVGQMYRSYKEHCQENDIVPEKKHFYGKVLTKVSIFLFGSYLKIHMRNVTLPRHS